jgi:hypothetical protein
LAGIFFRTAGELDHGEDWLQTRHTVGFDYVRDGRLSVHWLQFCYTGFSCSRFS